MKKKLIDYSIIMACETVELYRNSNFYCNDKFDDCRPVLKKRLL